MVKTLVLIRHGVSERGSEDMSRELTRAGQRALSANYPHIFGLLGPEGEEAEIWTSPALRALETAEIVAEALDAEGLLRRADLGRLRAAGLVGQARRARDRPH